MKKIVLVFVSLFLTACSPKLLVPFEEEKVCQKGVGYGYCARITDIYEDSVKNPYKYGIRGEGRR
ncbi:MAG: hypothetical protein QXX12_02080 [Nanopusillaceae archaeon]